MDRSSLRYVRVWDPLVRFGHWALVAAFAVAYLTQDDLLNVHVWAGYAVGIIVIVRTGWGFVGPRHARFSDFFRGPVQILAYLRDLLFFRARRYLGHSPAGGAMVIALLISLAATVASGIALYGAEKHAGPLQGLFAGTDSAPVIGVVHPAAAEEGSRAQHGNAENNEELLEGAHEFFANLTLGLVILHVFGVLLASAVHRENLIRAMITGDKRVDVSEPRSNAPRS
jgi:cytochrome b